MMERRRALTATLHEPVMEPVVPLYAERQPNGVIGVSPIFGELDSPQPQWQWRYEGEDEWRDGPMPLDDRAMQVRVLEDGA